MFKTTDNIFDYAKNEMDKLYKEVDQLFAKKGKEFTVDELLEIFDGWVSSIASVQKILVGAGSFEPSVEDSISRALYGIKHMRYQTIKMGDGGN